jgi:hypothetical protein
MDCKIPGRTQTPQPSTQFVLYGLDGLMPGQAKYAHQRANAFINRVMIDPAAPVQMRDMIRSLNAVGVLMLQELIAAFHRQESIHESQD